VGGAVHGLEKKTKLLEIGNKEDGFFCFFLILVGGIASGIYAETKVEQYFTVAVNKLGDEVNAMTITVNNVTRLVNDSRLHVPGEVVDEVKEAMGKLDDSMDDVNTVFEHSGSAKEVFVYVSVAWVALVGVAALLYHCSHNKFLFHLIGFMAWWVVFAICVFTIMMFTVSIVFTDICKELDYQPGLLDLLNNITRSAYNKVSNNVQESQQNLVSSTCNAVDEYCPQQPDLCDCTFDNFPEMTQRTVVDDDAETYTVYDCSTECKDVNLKNVSQGIVDAVFLFNLVDEVLNALQSIIVGFQDPSVKETIRGVVCETDEISTPLWVSLVLVLGGVGFIAIGLLVVDRRLCCKEALEDEGYLEMKM